MMSVPYRVGVRRFGLGTVIAKGDGIPKSTVGVYCQQGMQPGVICCRYLGGGTLPDGTVVCPTGTGPVPSEFDQVSLEIMPDGRARIVAGSPYTVLSDPFALPGDTRPPPATPAPGGGGGNVAPSPSDRAGTFLASLQQYAVPAAIIAGVAILGSVLLRSHGAGVTQGSQV